MSENLVNRLGLARKFSATGKPEYGYLGQKMFKFGGTVALQWRCKDKDKSKLNQCRVIPRQEIDVYLPSSLMPPRSPQEKELTVPNPLSSPSSSGLNGSSPSATSSSTEYTGSFDGDGLEDAVDNSEEYLILPDY
jgi:hypothetical protein